MNQTKQLNMADQSFYGINRQHKDGLFSAAFREKEDLLSLYNAMNDTDYQNPDELTVYTLEDAVYIGIKNDISFLVGEMLNLYEHQSTRNPNMPMRGFLYLARNFEAYIEQNNLNIYGSVLQKFPLPQYYIFYNGSEQEPDQRIMKLSDSFPKIHGKEPCLECTATLLNINYGHNSELLQKCKQLKDYATFIYYIRRNQKQGLPMQQAVDKAIDECIRQDIMKKFLVKCRGEVRNMVLSTFNREAYERDLRAEGRLQGQEEGELKKLVQLVSKKLKKNKSPEVIAEELEEELSFIIKICKTIENSSTEYEINDSILMQIKYPGEIPDNILSSFNQEIYERDLRAEDRIKGQEEGELKKLIQQTSKKLKKNKSPEVIAGELEEELPVIIKICGILENSADEHDIESILQQIRS